MIKQFYYHDIKQMIPFFKTQAVLDEIKMDFKPPMHQLKDLLQMVCREMTLEAPYHLSAPFSGSCYNSSFRLLNSFGRPARRPKYYGALQGAVSYVMFYMRKPENNLIT